MKIGFVSLGCCKNLVDSEQIMGMIKRGGHEIVANPKDAQAIIVNTCGFIESAKEESINTIFKMAQYKERNLEKLIVCGCLAQRYTETLKEEIPEIDAVIPIREYNTLASQLQKILGSDTLLDNLDARMYMMKQSLDTTQPGHFGPRVFALEGRMIYHRKGEDEE